MSDMTIISEAPTSAVNALVEITNEIVAAYIARNAVPPADLPALISTVHGTLNELGRPSKPAVEPERPTPSVPIRKSVTDEYIISLEDGRKFRSMKRYLSTLGLTPAEYRTKWGLPGDYPMVAPAYARARSALAKEMGLGQKRRKR